MAEAAVGHPAEGERGVRGGHGGRAGRLRRPYDPSRPVVCVDEGGKQLIGDVREPLPVRPGSPAKEDYEYERRRDGQPVHGVRAAGRAAARRGDRAEDERGLRPVPPGAGDEQYPDGRDGSCWCCDNLNTHTPAALYEAFEPAEARRLAERFEWHYTPKHGSWLNVAEMELSVLARQCLDRRIPDLETLRREVAAWEEARNAAVGEGRLAVHHRRRPGQAQEALPYNSAAMNH